MEKYKQHHISVIVITLLSSIVMWLALFGSGMRIFNFNLHDIGAFANVLLTALLTGIALCLIGHCLYYEKLKKIFFVFIYVYTIILIIVNLFCIAKFKLTIGPPMLSICADTNNMSEITSFFGTYFDWTAALILFIPIICGILLWKYTYKLIPLTKKTLYIFISIFIILTILSIAGVKKVGGLTASTPFMTANYAYRYMLKVRYQLAKMTADKTNKVELVSNNSDTPYFLFIIGESESRHFMGMYNNKYNTTPLCQKLIDKGSMFAFTDTISMKSSTALVMTPLLTFIDNENEQADITKFDPIVDVFTKAGYQAFWLSNHEKITKDLSYATFMSSRCDYSTFTSKTSGNAEFTPWLCTKDEELLPPFDDYLKTKAPQKDKNLFIFQIMGSHINYKDRYPESFSKFKSSDIKEENFDNSQKAILAEYFNTIYYTDYVLNELISRVADKDAIIIYAPDHGEEMWQGGFHGHGPSDVSKYMVEIPMLIWVSDKYKEKRPEIVNRIKSALNKPFMTDDMVHLLLDLAGIANKQYDPTRSPINEKYQIRERRINGIKYEDLRK